MTRHRNVALAIFPVLLGFAWLSCGDFPTSADLDAAGPRFAKGGKGGR
jgi:hypothetical protein